MQFFSSTSAFGANFPPFHMRFWCENVFDFVLFTNFSCPICPSCPNGEPVEPNRYILTLSPWQIVRGFYAEVPLANLRVIRVGIIVSRVVILVPTSGIFFRDSLFFLRREQYRGRKHGSSVFHSGFAETVPASQATASDER